MEAVYRYEYEVRTKEFDYRYAQNEAGRASAFVAGMRTKQSKNGIFGMDCGPNRYQQDSSPARLGKRGLPAFSAIPPKLAKKGINMSSKSIAAKYAPTTATLRSDLQLLKTDIDSLVTHAVDLTDAELSDAYEKIAGKVSAVGQSAREFAGKASDTIHHGVDVSTEYVKDRPKQSLALALGIGTLIGILLARAK